MIDKPKVLAMRPAGKYDRSCYCQNCANYKCDNVGKPCLVVCNEFISPIAGRAVSAETAKATDANLRPEVTR